MYLWEATRGHAFFVGGADRKEQISQNQRRRMSWPGRLRLAALDLRYEVRVRLYSRDASLSLSMVNFDLVERLFQILDPVLRDLGSFQVERFQAGQLFHLLQPFVRDLGVRQA